MKNIVLAIVFLISVPVFGMSAKLQADINELKALPQSSYLNRVGAFRISIVNHLKFEREECQSKFRAPRGTKYKQRQELLKQKEKCIQLIEDWNEEYFQALIVAKKRFIASLHKKELATIEQVFQDGSTKSEEDN